MGIHDNSSNDNNQKRPGSNGVPTNPLPGSRQGDPEQPAPGYVPPNSRHNKSSSHGDSMNDMFGNFTGNAGEFDWTQVGDLIGFHVNVNPAAKALTQFERSIKEYWDDYLSPDLKMEVIPIDKQSNPNLAVSVLVFTIRPSEKENAPVAYHTLIIEGSIESIPPRYEQIGNKQVEVLQLTSDTYDPTMMAVIDQTIRNKYPKAAGVYCADAEVVPRNFELTNEECIRRVTANSALAGRQQLALANDAFVDLNLARANRSSATLTQHVTFGRGIEEDQYGEPVRADIVMTMTATPTNNQNQLISNQTTITRATGYIDLLYVNSNNSNGWNQWQANPYAPTPVYQANLVLTSLINSKLQTLPALLQAIINVSFIRENDSWLPTLMPVGGKDEMHDIGNIGYDISLENNDKYAKLATTPDKFTVRDLFTIYQRFFHPGLAISLDVPECGPNTWQYAILAAAAMGRSDAREAIRKAANILTNGHFDKHYQQHGGSGSFVFTNENRILLGSYDGKDQRRDIRDFDYLAECGFAGKKDREEIVNYTDTYNATYPLAERMALRRTMIQSYLRNVVYTGYALRISFEAEFILALVSAAVDCGYHVIPQQPYMSDMSYQRANAGYINGAVLNSNSSGIFRNMAMNGFQNAGGYSGRF